MHDVVTSLMRLHVWLLYNAIVIRQPPVVFPGPAKIFMLCAPVCILSAAILNQYLKTPEKPNAFTKKRKLFWRVAEEPPIVDPHLQVLHQFGNI